MVGLEGKVSGDGKNYTGVVNFRGCSQFKVALNISGNNQSQVAKNTNAFVKKKQSPLLATQKNSLVREKMSKTLNTEERKKAKLGEIEKDITVPAEAYKVKRDGRVVQFTSLENLIQYLDQLDTIVKNDIATNKGLKNAFLENRYYVSINDEFPIGYKGYRYLRKTGWEIKGRDDSILSLIEAKIEGDFPRESIIDTLKFGMSIEDIKSEKTKSRFVIERENGNLPQDKIQDYSSERYIGSKGYKFKGISIPLKINMVSLENLSEFRDDVENYVRYDYFERVKRYDQYDSFMFNYRVVYGDGKSGYSISFSKEENVFRISNSVPEKNRMDSKFIASQKAYIQKIKTIEKQKAIDNSPLNSSDRKAVIAEFNKKADVLKNKSKRLASLSKMEAFKLRSELVKLSRDNAKKPIKRLVISAVNDLSKIKPSEYKKFNSWNKNTAKPLRRLIEKLQKLYEVGFNISSKDKIVIMYNLPIDNYSSISIDAWDYSPYLNFMADLSKAQYKWHKESEAGTLADASLKVPTGWSASGSKVSYKRPSRNNYRLVTPTEMIFEKIGESVGKVGAALVAYAGQIKQLEQNIMNSRKAYYSCFPKCKDFESKVKHFSKSLAEKDLYFYQISGKSNSLLFEGSRRQSIIIEGMSGNNGFTILDSGIPPLCSKLFNNWALKVGREFGSTSGDQMTKAFEILGNMAAGNIQAVQKYGREMNNVQEKAFISAANEYGEYQVCRDQFEFDRI